MAQGQLVCKGVGCKPKPSYLHLKPAGTTAVVLVRALQRMVVQPYGRMCWPRIAFTAAVFRQNVLASLSRLQDFRHLLTA